MTSLMLFAMLTPFGVARAVDSFANFPHSCNANENMVHVVFGLHDVRASFDMPTKIRRLGPGDDDVVAALATYPGARERHDLLADPRVYFLVAFDDDRPVGLVLAHELLRRHGDRSTLFVYEVEVDGEHRRRGIATALLGRLAELARGCGIREAFVLTEVGNEPANALYCSLGGTVTRVNQWDFEYGDG